MIPVRTALRIMPAAWFSLPMAIVAGWYATLLPSAPGYGLAATAAASSALPFIAAYVAASAAWEGSRLRRSRIWGGPWARSGLRVAAGLLVFPVASGLVATTAAIIVAHARASAFPPDPVIVGVLIVDLLVYASVGLALGIVAPAALAVPAAAIMPVLWLAFVPAIDPEWLRHLTGMYRDCCGLEQSLAPQAVLASVAMDIAFIATVSVACVVSWPRLRRALGAVGILATGALVGIHFASGLSFAPVVPRDTSLLSCAAVGGAEVCLWPEHAAASIQIDATIADVRGRWLAEGIDAPSTFTEASGGQAPGAIEIHPQDPLTNDAIIMALARGMLPPLGGCGRATTGGIAVPYLVAWYAAAGGLSQTSLQALDVPGDGVSPPILTVVDQLTHASPSVRRTWAARAAVISQSCDGVVPDLQVGG